VLIAEDHPWPPRGGTALRNAANAAALAAVGPLTIVGVSDPAGEHSPSPLGETRAIGLGHPPVIDPTDAWASRRGGHPSEGRWGEDAGRRWQRVLAESKPDVVVVEQLWLHRFAASAAANGAATMLDAHNVEADVYAAIAASTSVDPAATSRECRLAAVMAERTATLEAAAVAGADQVWACSPSDQARFRASGADARLVPNAVDTETVSTRPSRPRDSHLVFAASFAYPPNMRAARLLVDVILPRVAEQMPATRLSLVGRDPPAWLRARGREDGMIEVTGAVPSVQPWLDSATAVIVPLHEGGGTRFKVLEAMVRGVPVISTPKGVEGLAVRPGEHILVGADAAALAELAVLAHREDLTALTRAARRLVEERYSWRVAAMAVGTAVADALSRRRVERHG